jgi:hypothetical protein
LLNFKGFIFWLLNAKTFSLAICILVLDVDLKDELNMGWLILRVKNWVKASEFTATRAIKRIFESLRRYALMGEARKKHGTRR